MSVIGVDFGNSKCVVAGVSSGEVKTVLNEVSNRKTPSLVGYGDKRRYIGEAAVPRLANHAANTISNIKRFIGMKYSSPEIQKEIALSQVKIVQGEGDKPLFEVLHNGVPTLLPAESVAAALFGELRRSASEYLGVVAQDCVLSVPPFFTDSQRRALINAAHIGGLSVLGLMNETTAVALQYGLLRPLPADKSLNVLFFDMGHAHLNVSVVEFKQGQLKVLSTASDANIGGRDFDNEIINIVLDQIYNAKKLDVRSNRKAFMRICKEVESNKKVLSANLDTVYSIECLMEDEDVKGVVTRSEFEEAAGPLLNSILKPIEEAIAKSGLNLSDLDALEVIGGSVRIPSVVSRLESFFGRPVSRTCDGDESVARGCALQAAMLSPKFRVLDFKVSDIAGYPIELLHGTPGASEPEGINCLFEENNSIPSLKAMTFKRDEPMEVVFRYRNDGKATLATREPVIATYLVSGMKKVENGDEKPKMKLKMKLDSSGKVSLLSAQLFEEYFEEVEVSSEATTDNSSAPKNESSSETAAAGDSSQDAPPEQSLSETAEVSKQIEKKKKVKKTDLTIEERVIGAMDKVEFDALFEKEASMSNEDRIVAETLSKKNDLESYIYDIRDKVQYEISEYVKDNEKESYLKYLDEAEEWLYNEGYDAQKSDYVSRLSELKKMGDKFIQRQWEAENRSDAILNFSV